MTTFQELQEKLTKTKHRKALVEYMINHFDTEFRATAAGPAKKKLLTDDRQEVPESAFEEEVAFLLEDLKQLEEDMSNILGSPIAKVQEEAQAEPPAPAPPPESKKLKKAKPAESTTQGEA